MIKSSLIILFLFMVQATSEACPACAGSKAQSNVWQTFWILSVMGILPLVIFAVVSLIIVRLHKNEKKSVSDL